MLPVRNRGVVWLGWGFRIEWDQAVGDIQPFAAEVLGRHIVPKLAWGEDDLKHVYLISTLPPGLLTREAALLLAHQLATQISGKVNEDRGASSPQLLDPSINAFEFSP
jgi:hypothetical protein